MNTVAHCFICGLLQCQPVHGIGWIIGDLLLNIQEVRKLQLVTSFGREGLYQYQPSAPTEGSSPNKEELNSSIALVASLIRLLLNSAPDRYIHPLLKVKENENIFCFTTFLLCEHE